MASSEETGEMVINEEVTRLVQDFRPQNGTLVIKMIGNSYTENLIREEDAVKNLLRDSKFKDEMVGDPRFYFREHKIIINIRDISKIPELMKINALESEDIGSYPVECYSPLESQPRTPAKGGMMYIKFIGKSESKNIINDRNLITSLIKESDFGQHYSGVIKYNPDRQEIGIYIKNKEDIQELIEIDQLGNPYHGIWPISCRVPSQTGFTDGVMKRIHPNVPEERIKQELSRNGYRVSEVWRITKPNKDPTYNVRIRFSNGIIPNQVQYYWSTKKIHKYIPRVRICHRCAKSGHKAENCTSRQYNCPMCNSSKHGRDNCDQTENIENRRCNNCGGNHSANYRGCTYQKKNKKS